MEAGLGWGNHSAYFLPPHPPGCDQGRKVWDLSLLLPLVLLKGPGVWDTLAPGLSLLEMEEVVSQIESKSQELCAQSEPSILGGDRQEGMRVRH